MWRGISSLHLGEGSIENFPLPNHLRAAGDFLFFFFFFQEFLSSSWMMLTSLKTYDKPAKFPVARGPLRDDCHAASFRECVLYDSTCVSYFFHALLMSERNVLGQDVYRYILYMRN